LWSERVLASVVRHASERDRATRDGVQRRIDATQAQFYPDSMVTGFEHLEPEMRNDPGDRHVLAAAKHGGADYLVTSNMKHFPKDEMDRHGIVAIHPDDFLLHLLDEHEDTMLKVLHTCVTKRRQPPEEVPAYLDALERGGVPKFAAAVRELLACIAVDTTTPVVRMGYTQALMDLWLKAGKRP
jgi:hypothetical protein